MCSGSNKGAVPPPPWDRTIVYVALGSNLGDSRMILANAFERLQDLSTAPLSISSVWRSDPLGCPPGSPPFLNAVVGMNPPPGDTPRGLLTKLQAMERAFGRVAKVVLNEPRPIDLDLIAFGTQTESSPELTLPHPRAHLRRFVLAPLAEIAPGLILPNQSKTVQELLDGLGNTQEITRIG